ncbi:unnamed protein product, partial [Tetraodon nigroviridis]
SAFVMVDCSTSQTRTQSQVHFHRASAQAGVAGMFN